MEACLLLGLPSASLPGLKPNNNLDKRQLLQFPITSVWCGRTRSPASGAARRVGRPLRYSFEDELNADGDDLDDEFGFSSGAKRRVWWSSDDNYDDWDVDEDNDPWIFKVVGAFGWMLPAIAISLLLGTGPNAFLMALAVPLGQSVLSLAIDKVWGSSSPKSRPRTRARPRTRNRPFARAAAASDVKTNEAKQEETETGKGTGSYKSWVTVDTSSYEKGVRGVPKFGGWDELDKQTGTRKVPKRAPNQKDDGVAKQLKKDKFSQIGRVRDRPLLLRLLIAMFPFLGSWTKLLL